MQIFHDLRFPGSLGIMLFSVLDIVLDHLPNIGKGFSRNQFGRERVIQRRQNLLLNLLQRNCVIRFFARQFFDRKIVWEMDDHQARLFA